MPYKSEHACSLQAVPQGAKVRRTSRVMRGKSVSVIWAKIRGKMRMASVRMKTGTWSADAAGSLCKSLGGTFHPARRK